MRRYLGPILWEYIQEPCKKVKCEAVIRITRSELGYLFIVQHGDNPEHRKEISHITSVKTQKSMNTLVRELVQKIHSPRPWEIKAATSPIEEIV